MTSNIADKLTANDKTVKKVNTPYDDVFRTMINDCNPLLFPMINEIFGKSYTGNEKIDPSPNEHFLNKQNGKEDKRVTDSNFTILGEEATDYLFECQTQPDSSMTIRIYEYATQISLNNRTMEANALYVTIPHSAVLYLRSTRKTPDDLQIHITTPDGTVLFNVKIITITDYDINGIFEKNLLFLIPFYMFHYGNTKQLEELEHDSVKLNKLIEEFSEIVSRLDQLTKQGSLSLFHYKTILEMSNKVVQNLAAGYNNILKGVKAVMGGNILEYEAKTIYREGIRAGEAAGFRDGEAAGKVVGFRDGEAVGKVVGFRDGEFTATLGAIKELMKNLKLSAEQAMQAIGIPAIEQPKYQEKL